MVQNLREGCWKTGNRLFGSRGGIERGEGLYTKELFDLILVLLIPFGIVCIVLSGGRAIERLRKTKITLRQDGR